MFNTKMFCLLLIVSIVIFSLSSINDVIASEAYERSTLVKKGMTMEEAKRILGRPSGGRWYQISGEDMISYYYSDESKLYLRFRKAPYKPAMPGILEEIEIEKKWYQIN